MTVGPAICSVVEVVLGRVGVWCVGERDPVDVCGFGQCQVWNWAAFEEDWIIDGVIGLDAAFVVVDDFHGSEVGDRFPSVVRWGISFPGHEV